MKKLFVISLTCLLFTLSLTTVQAGTCGGSTDGTCDRQSEYCQCDGTCPAGVGKCTPDQEVPGDCYCAGGPTTQCNADDYGRVNCPAGQTKTNTVVSGPLCVRKANLRCIGGGNEASGLGSAQSLGSECECSVDEESGYETCKSYDVWTYSCCPNGTTNTCHYEPDTYTYSSTGYGGGTACFVFSNGGDPNTLCQSGYTYVSSQFIEQWQSLETRCLRGEENAKGNRPTISWGYYRVTCTGQKQVCECLSNCSAPTAPTLTTPLDNASISTTMVGLSWTASTFDTACAGEYRVYVDQNNPPTTLRNTVAKEGSTTVNFTGVRGNTYYWYVSAVAGSNSPVPSAVRRFTILDNQITGQVFYDPTNTCGGSGWSTGGVTVSVDGAAGTAVSGTGIYGATAAVGASHTLTVNIPANYACSTGAGCNTCSRSGIGSPSANNNFYLTDSRESWWQAEGAGIYAGGAGGVRSILPSSSLRLILAPVGGTEGLLMTSTGTVDIGDVGSVSDSGWRAVSRYRGKKMDYNYFAANMGVVRGQDSDWQSDTLNLQADDGRDFWYMDPVGSTATIGAGSPWNVTGGDSHVIFVNGNLDINSDIVVAPGSFLALIVKGDVIVDPTVANLEGLYVIDGSFVTETAYVEGVIDDIQLETGGTIVAWGSLSLSRSLGTGNITVPAEKFVYRSDLLTNMPDKMKTFVMQWNEVVPGTFQ